MRSQIEPIFIVGCQRSGSTLLAATLGAHSDLLCPPEGQFVSDLLGRFRPERSYPQEEIIHAIARHPRFGLWDLDIPEMSQTYATFAEALRHVADSYGAAVGKPQFHYWIDHQPGHVAFCARLAELFPQAKFIHIVRDGRAVAASLLRVKWGPNVVASAASFWREKIAYGLAAETCLGAERILRVRFEDLTCGPEETLKQICDFLKIEYHRELVSTREFVMPDYTKGQHALVGKAFSQERIDGWKSQLTQTQICDFEALTQDLLPMLGYTHLNTDYSYRPLRIRKWASLVWDKLAKLYGERLNEWRIAWHSRD